MNYYEAWFTLRNSGKDLEFVERVNAFLGHLEEKGMIEGYTLKRRKLGFGPDDLGDFNLSIEVRDLAQLDEAFSHAATRGPEVEPLHAGVYAMIENVKFALYRDFPDPRRHGLNR
ncbi:MAG: DUF6614 family protein [Candidatus Krumholzibacteriia bacterium]